MGLPGEFYRQIQKDFLRFGRESDRPYRLAASVGYSRYAPGQTLSELSAEADKALYREKTLRKSKARTA